MYFTVTIKKRKGYHRFHLLHRIWYRAKELFNDCVLSVTKFAVVLDPGLGDNNCYKNVWSCLIPFVALNVRFPLSAEKFKHPHGGFLVVLANPPPPPSLLLYSRRSITHPAHIFSLGIKKTTVFQKKLNR